MNNTKYIRRKDIWQATRLVNNGGTLTTKYLGVWPTKKDAEKAPIPTRWDGSPSW